jgi:hypothetical protein
MSLTITLSEGDFYFTFNIINLMMQEQSVLAIDERNSSEQNDQGTIAWYGLIATLASVFGFSVHAVYFYKALGEMAPIVALLLAVLIAVLLEVAIRGFAPQFANAVTSNAMFKGKRKLVTVLGFVGYLAMGCLYVVTAENGAAIMAVTKLADQKPDGPTLSVANTSDLMSMQKTEMEAALSSHKAKKAEIARWERSARSNSPDASTWIRNTVDKRMGAENARYDKLVGDISGKHSTTLAAIKTSEAHTNERAMNIAEANLNQWSGQVGNMADLLKWLTILSFAVFTIATVAKSSMQSDENTYDPALEALPNGIHNLIGGVSVATARPMHWAGDNLKDMFGGAVGAVAAVPQRPQRPQRPQNEQPQATGTQPQGRAAATGAQPQATATAAQPQDRAKSAQPQATATAAQPQDRATAAQPQGTATATEAQPQAANVYDWTPGVAPQAQAQDPQVLQQTIVNHQQTVLEGPRSSRDNSEQGIIRRHLDQMAYSATASKEVVDMIKACKANYNRIPNGNNQALYQEKAGWLLQHGIRMVGSTATIA